MSHDFSTFQIAFQNNWWTMFERDGWFAARPAGDVDGGVCLVIDSDDNVVAVRVFRFPLNETVVELPRGGGCMESDMSSLETALREAREETGVSLKDAEIVDLGEVFPDSGILASRVRLVAAVLPYPVLETKADLTEVKSVETIPLEKLRQMAAYGEIDDALTIAAIFRLDAYRADRKKTDVVIEVLDASKQPVARFHTNRPEWSFDQYCRNRETSGWSWRLVAPDAVG